MNLHGIEAWATQYLFLPRIALTRGALEPCIDVITMKLWTTVLTLHLGAYIERINLEPIYERRPVIVDLKPTSPTISTSSPMSSSYFLLLAFLTIVCRRQ